MSVFERINGRLNLDVSTEEWELPDEVERTPTSSAEARAVRFPVAFRGYDRAKVDEYLEDVSRVMEQLETVQTPDDPVKREIEQIGEQTTAILQRAYEAEEAITSRARSEAHETLRSAEAQARATCERGEARVRELDEDTELLWQERHRLLEDMQRLFNQVGRVMAAANKRFPAPVAPAIDPEPVEPAGGLAALDARTVDGEEEAPVQPEDEEPTATRASAGLFGEELAWEDAPEYRPRERDGEGPDDHPEPPHAAGRTSLPERPLTPRSSDHA